MLSVLAECSYYRVSVGFVPMIMVTNHILCVFVAEIRLCLRYLENILYSRSLHHYIKNLLNHSGRHGIRLYFEFVNECRVGDVPQNIH